MRSALISDVHNVRGNVVNVACYAGLCKAVFTSWLLQVLLLLRHSKLA